MPKKRCICEVCGKEFYTYIRPSGGHEKGRFCSIACRGKWIKENINKREKRICPVCDSEFEAMQCIINRGGGKYCSRKCVAIARSKKVKIKCKNCGKILEVHFFRKDEATFCSKKCDYEWRDKQKVKKICEYCGKEFVAYNYEKDRAKFCSKECRYKWMSENLRGDNNPIWGKKVSEEKKEERKKRISKARTGIRLSKETKDKLREKRLKQKIPRHHTKPEEIFMEICHKYNLPFHYVGDGSFWIGDINPDFVECNGKKIVIEIFGDYWHSPLLNPNMREKRTYNYRKKTLKKYGWRLIVFWESDMKRKDAEKFVLAALAKEKLYFILE